ncbi:reverse transcriptase domain-containing protein [Tanacetum coccineum]
MTGPTLDPSTPVNRTNTDDPNNPPNLQEQILNHISSLKALVQLHNESPTGLVTPIRLDFDDQEKPEEKPDEGAEDLRKPYKEVLRSPFSRRIVEFSAPHHRTPTNLKIYDGSTDPDDHITRFVGAANQGEWEMPVWCRMFQQTLDGPARGWFDRLPNGCIDNWTDLREAFVERFSLRRKCCKDPTEVSKIVRKAHEALPDFKERWTEEMSYIPDVPIVMQISSFMSNSKCPELARRFSDQVPKTITEMMKRVDDFVKSEEAFKNTELPKGRTIITERIITNRTRGPDRRYDNRRHDFRRREVNHLKLDSLTKLPSEILATELQLQLPPCPPTLAPPKKENLDRYCEYHGEKGHYTNDYFHLKKQLEIALESGKLNHLVKDVRQKGNNQGRPMGNNNRGKIINMVTDDVSDDPLIVEAEVGGFWVRRVFVDQGVAVQVMFEHCFNHLSQDIKSRLTPTQTELVGFFGEQLVPIRKTELEVQFGGGGLTRRTMMKFTVVRASSPYNIILGRTGLQELRAVSSTVHAMLKLPTPKGIATLCARAEPVYECRWSKRRVTKQEVPAQKTDDLKTPNPEGEEKPSDMAGVPRRLIRHALNVNNSVLPVAQKRRVLGTEKSRVVIKEVEEWVKAGIVRPMKYPTWISNPVLVKKVDGTWRMCIDFKNLNAACPKDYYPLPEIDLKIEAVMGHPFKCFLDAYKGYHQIQMSEEDEEKTAFYTDQGTYCYVKMPFGLKNAGATYQRLVDSAFHQQLGRNLEAYVDNMVIKKGKFLGYMVTSEGIRANPKKMKAIADMQSPKTLKEMQSLSGKLAALNRFLSRSAKRSLPFFETLKNITKENKEDYRWTEEAEHAFQELKKLILELPTLTTPERKETLFIYLAISRVAVSGVLVVDHRGKQTPIRYVSRTLHEVERNCSPLEKLALCLLHLPRRLRQYFEAHPIQLGAYNITYIPRTAIKGQVLADFINEVSVGVMQLEVCNSAGEEALEEWILYTDGALSQKGVGAGLFLIDPSGTEYTYAIRLTFLSTNNEAEYEALLAGLRMTWKMKVQELNVKVDSKLVACQMNGEFVANDEGMAKYLAKAKEQAASFKKFSIKNIPRN